MITGDICTGPCWPVIFPCPSLFGAGDGAMKYTGGGGGACGIGWYGAYPYGYLGTRRPRGGAV